MRRTGYGWPLGESLTGIPHLFAFSLAYGPNLLRPERDRTVAYQKRRGGV